MQYLIYLLICFLIACSSDNQEVEKKTNKNFKSIDSQISQKIIEGKYKEAKQLAFDNYDKKDHEKLVNWFMIIEDEIGKGYKKYLEIQDGWKWVEEDYYNYIRGRVKNTGDRTISYFKIKAEYKNKNKEVIDLDYTNYGDNLPPNMSKEFEIMHRNSHEYKYVSIYVDEVNIK